MAELQYMPLILIRHDCITHYRVQIYHALPRSNRILFDLYNQICFLVIAIMRETGRLEIMCTFRTPVRGIALFQRNHFGATYFVAGRFLHRSFRRQFGALLQFTYLGLGLVKSTEYWRRKGPRRNGCAEKSWAPCPPPKNCVFRTGVL